MRLGKLNQVKTYAQVRMTADLPKLSFLQVRSVRFDESWLHHLPVPSIRCHRHFFHLTTRPQPNWAPPDQTTSASATNAAQRPSTPASLSHLPRGAIFSALSGGFLCASGRHQAPSAARSTPLPTHTSPTLAATNPTGTSTPKSTLRLHDCIESLLHYPAPDPSLDRAIPSSSRSLRHATRLADPFAAPTR
ncbi:hypothetical protein LIA77_03519 [Sarocladium implicatum]|nr:hypothetical protein LIA77_03519 [Sarocladium implicatum]